MTHLKLVTLLAVAAVANLGWCDGPSVMQQTFGQQMGGNAQSSPKLPAEMEFAEEIHRTADDEEYGRCTSRFVTTEEATELYGENGRTFITVCHMEFFKARDIAHQTGGIEVGMVNR